MKGDNNMNDMIELLETLNEGCDVLSKARDQYDKIKDNLIFTTEDGKKFLDLLGSMIKNTNLGTLQFGIMMLKYQLYNKNK